MKRTQPFAIGDVVTTARADGEQIVIEIDTDRGALSYGLLDAGWWFKHDELVAVRPADKKSLRAVEKFWEELEYGPDEP